MGADTAPQPVNAPIATKMENQPKSPDEIEAGRLVTVLEDKARLLQALGMKREDLPKRYPEVMKLESPGQIKDFKGAIAVLNLTIKRMDRDIAVRKTVNSVTTDQAITGLPNGVLVAGGILAVVGVVAAAIRKK